MFRGPSMPESPHAGSPGFARAFQWSIMIPMKRTYTTATAISAALLLASAAGAQVTLNSVRIGAKDSVALAKFYQAAFGMQETNRIASPAGPEIFVNFGATTDSAKANK